MKTVILCGGKGTRLREETEVRPKPMVPIGGRPILWHIMKIYAAHGHRDFILCLGYKGEVIKDFFRNFRWMVNDVTVTLGDEGSAEFHGTFEEADWRITLVDTGLETLTGGRIERIRPFLEGNEDFFLTYGDGVGDIDINASLEFHRTHGKTLTITAVHPPGRFGELGFADEDRVELFTEKPQVETGFINGGFCVANRRLFNHLHDADDVMLERRPMNDIAAAGELMAFRHYGFWQPMDNFHEFTLLNRLWDQGDAPWKTW